MAWLISRQDKMIVKTFVYSVRRVGRNGLKLATGPKEAKSTVLSIVEEAIIVAIRLPGRRYSPTGSPGRLSDTQRGDNMKFVSAAALALIGCLVGFNSANAQEPL